MRGGWVGLPPLVGDGRGNIAKGFSAWFANEFAWAI